ncbi:hypothetical protein [Halobaculum marinum]|uniref:Helix-turn-helix domain-containing protein n=1 Tax=Halobaculum marinum TaxID=3031996 RepID=A0ABD5WZF6_9EURY|nr:hypothetical protein [Halobaculum sp. DT55]
MTESDHDSDRQSVWSAEAGRLDRVFGVLSHPARRVVLDRLVERSPDEADPLRVDRVVSGADAPEAGRLELHHVHLPKLAAHGYADWDADEETIRRGPSFEEVAPVVRLCRRRGEAFPAEWP